MSVLSSIGTIVSNVLTKAETLGGEFLAALEGDEVIVGNDVVAFINATETIMNSAKATISTIPTVGTAGAAVISEAEAILNNLKGIAEAIASGGAQAPGGETNV